MTTTEKEAWVTALTEAVKSARPHASAGPMGLYNEHLRAMLSDDASGALIPALAELMPALLAHPPAALSRSRLHVIVKYKADGRRKPRAIAVGEPFMRLLERACLVRYSEPLAIAAPRSAAGIRDGALQAGVALQNARAHGKVIASLDARRAYDAVAHAAILEALADAKVPPLLHKFVRQTLDHRQYALAGELITPPAGRGTAQGTCLGPALFALVAERAARAAERASPDTRAITYLDNLFIVGTAPEAVAAAVDAAVAQWRADGLDRGDAFAINGTVPGLPHADDESTILGVSITGEAGPRFAAARRLAGLAHGLDKLSELLVVRSCAAARVVCTTSGRGSQRTICASSTRRSSHSSPTRSISRSRTVRS
jgi:hypothetical protein